MTNEYRTAALETAKQERDAARARMNSFKGGGRAAMRSFTQEEMIAMWRRVVSIVEPAARNPYREAVIKDESGETLCKVTQSWRIATGNARAIAWDVARLDFGRWGMHPDKAREMVLAISTLADLAETWNEDAGQPIPEQMERLKAEEAA